MARRSKAGGNKHLHQPTHAPFAGVGWCLLKACYERESAVRCLLQAKMRRSFGKRNSYEHDQVKIRIKGETEIPLR